MTRGHDNDTILKQVTPKFSALILGDGMRVKYKKDYKQIPKTELLIFDNIILKALERKKKEGNDLFYSFKY